MLKQKVKRAKVVEEKLAFTTTIIRPVLSDCQNERRERGSKKDKEEAKLPCFLFFFFKSFRKQM